MSKIAFIGALVAVGLLVASPARANVNKGELWAGRLGVVQSCFVQIDLKAVESDLFNGNEKVRIGDSDWATFSPLAATRTNLSAGQSVLIGSEKFKAESGLAPDITVPDAECEKITGGITLSFIGSFGPEAGKLEVKEISELEVVGALLRFDLEYQEFKAKSLGGEKTLGTAGGGSSGSPTTPGGSQPGGSQPSGPSGSQPATPSGSDDSCTVHGARASDTGIPVAAAMLGFVSILGRVRRRGRR